MIQGEAVSGPHVGRQRLLAGDPRGAIQALEPVAAADPADIEARYWLASARLAAGDPRAGAAMEAARTLHALVLARDIGVDIGRCRTDGPYAARTADQLYARKLVAMSGVIRAMALGAGPSDAKGWVGYGLALQHQGRADAACEVFRAASEQFPSAAVSQYVIFPQLFRDDGDARHAAAARDWVGTLVQAPPPAPHANPPRKGRTLRIGYVAPRFAGCQLSQFMTPVLERHDPAAVGVTLYPADAATETDWPAWIEVHPIGGLADADAAALIRRDGIDVLVDCWGHAALSRLTVFAHRPAPVQAAWINFIQTTGLPQMDYVLHADGAATGALAGLFTEAIWRIGPVFNAFRPAAGRLPPVPTPASASGQMTFGSFKHPAKLSEQTFDGWAAVLRGLPTARLLLKYAYFADPVLQRVTRARFAARGVAPERIAFADHSTGEDYFRAFGAVDLMLESWPEPGSTTTLDSLSNGVPVLVMAGRNLAGQYVRSILAATGLAELITESPEAFVARALELGADVQRLDALRARTRPAFDASPVCDEVGFTRRVEAAFGEMFDRWQGRAAA